MRALTTLTLTLTFALAACGGGSEADSATSQGPELCFGGTHYCLPGTSSPISIEHKATNRVHISQGRAVAELVDGSVLVYVGMVPIGGIDDFTSVCEVAVRQFVPDACE